MFAGCDVLEAALAHVFPGGDLHGTALPRHVMTNIGSR